MIEDRDKILIPGTLTRLFSRVPNINKCPKCASEKIWWDELPVCKGDDGKLKYWFICHSCHLKGGFQWPQETL